jgi:hypothetical protein
VMLARQSAMRSKSWATASILALFAFFRPKRPATTLLPVSRSSASYGMEGTESEIGIIDIVPSRDFGSYLDALSCAKSSSAYAPAAAATATSRRSATCGPANASPGTHAEVPAISQSAPAGPVVQV